MKTLPRGTELVRLYKRGGSHPTQWHEFRHFGPLDFRFDHHLPPKQSQSRGILYAATGKDSLTTVLAEVFQATRFIDHTRNDPWLVTFALVRDVCLLDLHGYWPTHAGASMAINTGPRASARNWSRAIYEQYPHIEGLAYPSSMNSNQPAVALFERAVSAIPVSPTAHHALSDPALLSAIRIAAAKIRYVFP